jgi:hypothetical protein
VHDIWIEDDRPAALNSQQKRDAAWGVPGSQIQLWPALLALLVAVVLYVTLPGHLYYGPVWVLPVVEGALFLLLLVARRREDEGQTWQHRLVVGFIAVMNAANVGSLLLLIHALLGNLPVNGHGITAQHLLVWSAQIWVTNVIVFGLWYWELDRGGPHARLQSRHRAPDFLFPQMNNPDAAPRGWTPSFLDYLYTSFTNAAAFSPTDTLPLTGWAKTLFAIQSMTSLLTAVLVIARIANILPG